MSEIFNLSSAEIKNHSVIEEVQVHTRSRIENVGNELGKFVDITVTTGAETGKLIAYSTTRTARGFWDVLKAGWNGVNKKKYPTSN